MIYKKRAFKLFSSSFLVTGIKVFCSLLVNKIFAVIAGPAGFALVAQFQNLISMGFATSSFSLQNGWVTLTAKSRENPHQLNALWRGGLFITAVGSSITLVLISFYTVFGVILFPSILGLSLQQSGLFLAIPGIFSLTIVMICGSIVNGLGDYKKWAAISIFASVSQCLWVFVFLKWSSWNIFSVVATQSIVSVFFALWICRHLKIFSSLSKVRKEFLAPWKSFAAMGLLPMIFVPVIQMVTRSILGSRLGWDIAGLWQGAFRISDAFNVCFSSILGVLVLPYLSRIQEKNEFLRQLKKTLMYVLLLSGFCLLLFCLFRNQILLLLFSETFLDIAPLLPIQFLGDFFRSGCWCLGLALVAKQAAKQFLFIELFSQVLFLSLSVGGISYFGIKAPFLAHVIENGVTFLILIFVVRRLSWKTR